MSSYDSYASATIDVVDRVATIAMHPHGSGDPSADRHGPQHGITWELPSILDQLRDDPAVRVIVITGANDGEFLASVNGSAYRNPKAVREVTDPKNSQFIMGVVRSHQMMAEIEKPIVARVNGDAIGFGCGVLFGADLIVAREDAVVSDVHLGQGTVFRGDGTGPVGPPYGLVAGDGAGALVPLFLSPAKAKEFLFLSPTLTAKELEALDCINYAVPAEDLDEKTDELVQALLSKSAYALAWTKRIANRHVIRHLNDTLELARAYEHITIMQAEMLGFEDITHLE